MPSLWTCPACRRSFRQVHQRHACGVGSTKALLRGRPEHLGNLYRRLETFVKGLGETEIVARDRYALFRTTRIFADLTIMRDALRLVVHLDREVRDPLFFKIQGGRGRQIAHVAKIRTAGQLRAVMPYVREAYRFAAGEDRSGGRA